MSKLRSSAVFVLLALTAACADREEVTTQSATADHVVSAVREERAAAASEAAYKVAPPPPPAPAMAPAPAGYTQFPQSRSTSTIIRTGSANIEVDTLETAIAGIRSVAAQTGATITNTAVAGGRNSIRNATIELRVPANRFDDAVDGLNAIGTVQSVNVQAVDVGEEFVDLEARLANSRRLEARLIHLLDTRTGRLEDVLNVERELARVREEIERIEGRLRYLREHVAVSTLVVSMHEPAPITGAPGSNILLDALRAAWRNFVGVIAFAIAGLGYLIPVGAIAWIIWQLRRRRWILRAS